MNFDRAQGCAAPRSRSMRFSNRAASPASARPKTAGSVGRTILTNLLSNPFGGVVYPVNPKRPHVLGACAPTRPLAKCRAKVDLAVIVTPAKAVPALVEEMREKRRVRRDYYFGGLQGNRRRRRGTGNTSTREEDLPRPTIRPYPSQYAGEAILKDGAPILIRPIRTEDEPLLRDFHETLSERSVYQRYLQPLGLNQRVAHERLIRV